MRNVDVPISGEFQIIEQRLVARFSPPLRAEEVKRCLVECIARFKSASVRTYLSVLIERAATDRLRAAVRDVDVLQHPKQRPVVRVVDVRVTSSQADRRASVRGV